MLIPNRKHKGVPTRTVPGPGGIPLLLFWGFGKVHLWFALVVYNHQPAKLT